MRVSIDDKAPVAEIAQELEAQGMHCTPIFERDEAGKIIGTALIAEPIMAYLAAVA